MKLLLGWMDGWIATQIDRVRALFNFRVFSVKGRSAENAPKFELTNQGNKSETNPFLCIDNGLGMREIEYI